MSDCLVGKTLIVLKVMPEEVGEENRIEKEIVEKIGKEFEVKETKIEPVAFGLNAIKVAVLLPEKQEEKAGIIEEKIKRINGVSDVTVELMTLL